MGTDLTQERQQAHALLDRLPNEKLTAVVHLLQAISDPLARSLANAPIDDEPISEEEMLVVEASREWFKDHAPISHEEVRAEFTFAITLRFVLQGGAEYNLTRNWSVFGDIKEVWLAGDAHGQLAGVAPVTVQVKLNPSLVSVGIKYRFRGSVLRWRHRNGLKTTSNFRSIAFARAQRPSLWRSVIYCRWRVNIARHH